jgi:hypothetical protein
LQIAAVNVTSRSRTDSGPMRTLSARQPDTELTLQGMKEKVATEFKAGQLRVPDGKAHPSTLPFAAQIFTATMG